MQDLLSRFEKTLQESKPFLPGERVFVACSGGPDSVALVHLLLALRESWRLRLGILHFNHGLRGRASDRDAHFVQQLAKKYDLPFYQAHRKVVQKNGLSLEEAAREARYRFFVQTAKRYRISKIALAHTREDQAETVFMRVMQGTGLRGLAGIRPWVRLGQVVFVRPLLEISKAELLDFLKRGRTTFRNDRSNQSPRFLRNRVRTLLSKLAAEFNPRIVEALARIPAIVRDETDLLAWLEEGAWGSVLKKKQKQKIYLDRKIFEKFPPALQFRVLERALKMIDLRSGLNFESWNRLRGELHRKRFRTSFPRDLDLSLTPSRLLVFRKP